MHRYRSALAHLNRALDDMVAAGETCIVANIAHPIGLVERQLLVMQQRVIEARCELPRP